MSLRLPPSTSSSCLLLTHRRLFLPPQPLSLPTFPSLSRHVSLPPRASSSFNGTILQEELVLGEDGGFRNADKVRRWSSADSVRSILPGGTWWELPEDVQVKLMAKPVTVWRALARMWDLVARDRWVIYAAFSALILAALSAITIPHYLTSSIFSAQSGNVLVFRRNVYLLVVLCLAAGIARLQPRMIEQTILLFVISALAFFLSIELP